MNISQPFTKALLPTSSYLTAYKENKEAYLPASGDICHLSKPTSWTQVAALSNRSRRPIQTHEERLQHFTSAPTRKCQT